MAFKFWSIKSKVDDRSLLRNFVFASNSNKTHTFILLTLYHLVGPIYTQRMEEGNGMILSKTSPCWKKSTTPYLRGLFIFYAHRRACPYFCTGKLFTLFCPSICHALICDECIFTKTNFFDRHISKFQQTMLWQFIIHGLIFFETSHIILTIILIAH